jgi:hypothetical protein
MAWGEYLGAAGSAAGVLAVGDFAVAGEKGT